MIPLQTYNEYAAAKKVADNLAEKHDMVGLSVKDSLELIELIERITMYESTPTKVNTIIAEKGNVDEVTQNRKATN